MKRTMIEADFSRNMPTSVRVGPFDLCIMKESTRVRDNSNFGETRFDRLEIAIDPQWPRLRQRETLLHEILHCVMLTYFPRQKNEELMEAYIRNGAIGLFQVLRDNPEVADFICKEA